MTITEVSNMQFTFEAPISIEEVKGQKAIIRGTLLSEGISRNGNLYTIEEMENIANQAVGTKIEVGVDFRGRHTKSPTVGKIIEAFLDKTKRKIFYIAEIFGSIVNQVKKGWGVSIDGIARNASYVLSETGKVLIKVKDLILKKIQLVPPHVKVGVQGASVSSVEITECMIFQPKLNKRMLAIIATLASEGVI